MAAALRSWAIASTVNALHAWRGGPRAGKLVPGDTDVNHVQGTAAESSRPPTALPVMADHHPARTGGCKCPCHARTCVGIHCLCVCPVAAEVGVSGMFPRRLRNR